MDSIAIEQFNPERHYGAIEAWWSRWHDSPAPPVNCLPPTTFVAMRGERPIAAVSLYLTNADMAQLAFPIGDPDCPSKIAGFALKGAISAAMTFARVHMKGRGFIWFHTHNEAVDRLVRACGFEATDKCFVSHMIFQPDFDPDIISP